MSMKLLAADAADLSIMSAAVQDAIIRVGDLRYDPVGRAVSVRMSRFRHEDKTPSRIQAGLRIDGVMRLQSTGIDRSNSDAYAVVLGMTFEEIDAPEGLLTLNLAGGGALRLTVECLDLMLADVGEARATPHTPDHDLS